MKMSANKNISTIGLPLYNPNEQTTIKESKMKITGSNLFRWAGSSAIVAGIIFAGIQPIHPPDFLSSVTTGKWAIIISLKLAMCFLFLLGIVGLYVRQAEKTGWVGLAGFFLFSLSWALQSGFVFAEVLILPPLASAAPQFVDSYLGIVNGSPGKMNIGAIVSVYTFVGIFYLLGGMLFGIATFRAGVLPRWPAGLLAVTAILTPAAALFPHEIQRFAAVPMGIALAWLGYALRYEQREKTAVAPPAQNLFKLAADIRPAAQEL
jgi:hypothetical protein